ncbi:MAG: hypothetical protein KME27_18145 [Lyngbya sp. HA4199-MV5]|jgi:hypothetical protein|nr:hypothetical protein [Lyngbya sp. HA4199-MV5]
MPVGKNRFDWWMLLSFDRVLFCRSPKTAKVLVICCAYSVISSQQLVVSNQPAVIWISGTEIGADDGFWILAGAIVRVIKLTSKS